jgi:hypothetical protein
MALTRSKRLNKTLKSKGLKLPHGYELQPTKKRKKRVYGGTKRKKVLAKGRR